MDRKRKADERAEVSASDARKRRAVVVDDEEDEEAEESDDGSKAIAALENAMRSPGSDGGDVSTGGGGEGGGGESGESSSEGAEETQSCVVLEQRGPVTRYSSKSCYIVRKKDRDPTSVDGPAVYVYMELRELHNLRNFISRTGIDFPVFVVTYVGGYGHLMRVQKKDTVTTHVATVRVNRLVVDPSFLEEVERDDRMRKERSTVMEDGRSMFIPLPLFVTSVNALKKPATRVDANRDGEAVFILHTSGSVVLRVVYNNVDGSRTTIRHDLSSRGMGSDVASSAADPLAGIEQNMAAQFTREKLMEDIGHISSRTIVARFGMHIATGRMFMTVLTPPGMPEDGLRSSTVTNTLSRAVDEEEEDGEGAGGGAGTTDETTAMLQAELDGITGAGGSEYEDTVDVAMDTERVEASGCDAYSDIIVEKEPLVKFLNTMVNHSSVSIGIANNGGDRVLVVRTIAEGETGNMSALVLNGQVDSSSFD